MSVQAVLLLIYAHVATHFREFFTISSCFYCPSVCVRVAYVFANHSAGRIFQTSRYFAGFCRFNFGTGVLMFTVFSKPIYRFGISSSL